MNFLKACFIACILVNSFCLLRKKSQKTLLKAKQTVLNNYADAIYDALAKLKADNNAPIAKSSKLGQMAQQEATEILKNDDFYEHTRFNEWSSQAPNDYFTEISLFVELESLPDATAFAQDVMDELINQQPSYLSHAETHAGVSMLQSTEENTYIVTIQMLKKPDYYSSCSDQLFFSEENTKLTILSNGNKYDVDCDITTDDGGWTQIQDSNIHSTNGTVEINDLGIQYTELLWVAKTKYYMDMNKQWKDDWDFDGWNFEINMFKFDDKWYVSKDTPDHDSVKGDSIRGSGFSKIKDTILYFNIADHIKSLAKANSCLIRAVAIDDKFCSTKFIMSALPGRITAVSDVETLTEVDNADNEYNLYFSIYVR